jgi:hypothetical protein
MGMKFAEYNLPIDINPCQQELRHEVDFETMSRTIHAIENRYGRYGKNGQSNEKTI